MKKHQLIRFCSSHGWNAAYSGKAQAFYINVRNKDITLNDVEVVFAQHFGILPDWKLIID